MVQAPAAAPVTCSSLLSHSPPLLMYTNTHNPASCSTHSLTCSSLLPHSPPLLIFRMVLRLSCMQPGRGSWRCCCYSSPRAQQSTCRTRYCRITTHHHTNSITTNLMVVVVLLVMCCVVVGAHCSVEGIVLWTYSLRGGAPEGGGRPCTQEQCKRLVISDKSGV